MTKRTGRCLCGKVSFTADAADNILACHCGQCQRWTGGGPLFSVMAKNVEVSGGEDVTAYHASDWGERVACDTCGSILWWKMRGKPENSVALGLLDDASGMRVTEEIFVDYRPDWLPPFEGASQSTEAQEIEKFEAYMAREAEQ